jgi:hypothetical protein
VVVLSHDLWRRAFASDPNVVGREIAINTRAATVIGVTAAGFRGTDVGVSSEFWIPFSMIDEVEFRSGPVTQNRRRYWLAVLGRLQPAAPLDNGQAELDVIARRLNSVHGRTDDRSFHVERAGQIDPRVRSVALASFGVTLSMTVLVLLTACSNVA